MDFFAQANSVFSDQKTPDAFALQCPGGATQLHWGRLASRKVSSLVPHAFFDEHITEDWRAFHSLNLENNLSAPAPIAPLTKKSKAPLFRSDKAAWLLLCKKIEDGIESKFFQKIVPARFIQAEINKEQYDFIVDQLFARLCQRAAPNAYKFVIRAGQDYFFGATPELLFHRSKNSIFVPAIAGTRKVTLNNEHLKIKELWESKKEREEHEIVVRGIVESLTRIGLKPKYPAEPEVKRFGLLVHLFTPITCENLESIPSEALISALHPTAAIGGSPQKVAKDFLFQYEGWNRGLFSSPLHFVFEKEEICLVAIRSALLRPKSLRFFAGAGFVKGSDAEQEWEETEAKINSLASLFFEES